MDADGPVRSVMAGTGTLVGLGRCQRTAVLMMSGRTRRRLDAIGWRQTAHGIRMIGAQRLVLFAVVDDVVAVMLWLLLRWHLNHLLLLLWMADVIPHLMAGHVFNDGRRSVHHQTAVCLFQKKKIKKIKINLNVPFLKKWKQLDWTIYLESVSVTENGRRSRRTDERIGIWTWMTSAANLMIGSGFRRIRQHIRRHIIVHSFFLLLFVWNQIQILKYTQKQNKKKNFKIKWNNIKPVPFCSPFSNERATLWSCNQQ